EDPRPLPSYAPPAGEREEIVEEISVIEEPLPPSRLAPEMEALEEALDEAEFFVARGLHEDARAILQDQLGRTPTHPLVLERLRGVEEGLAGPGWSQTIERSMLGAAAKAPAASELDVAASLGALESPAESMQSSEVSSSMVEVDVDQVFAKFKAGV